MERIKVLYAGNTHIDYGAEWYIAKHLKAAGYEVYELVYPSFASDYSHLNSVLEAQIEGFKPNIVLMGKAMGLLYDDIMRIRNKYNVPMIQWIFDHMGTVNGEDRASWWRPQARGWNVCFNAEWDMNEVYRNEGINHHILTEGVDTSIFKPSLDNPQKSGVVFAGNLYNEWRNDLVTAFSSMVDINFKHFSNLRTDKLNLELNRSLISINTNYDDLSEKGWSARVVEHMASGILMMTPKSEYMEKAGFKDKENIVMYKPRNLADLRHKILYYLDNYEERKRIAEKGMRFVHSTQTWKHKIDEFTKVLKNEGLI